MCQFVLLALASVNAGVHMLSLVTVAATPDHRWVGADGAVGAVHGPYKFVHPLLVSNLTSPRMTFKVKTDHGKGKMSSIHPGRGRLTLSPYPIRGRCVSTRGQEDRARARESKFARARF